MLGFQGIGKEAQAEMTARVFVSFAVADREPAEAICAGLERLGLACWIASRDIPSGAPFAEAAVGAIRAAAAIVVVLSSHANGSAQMAREVALASNGRLLVVPIRLADVAPSKTLAHALGALRRIDVFDNWEAALEQLAERIEAVTGRGVGGHEGTT